MLPSEITSDLEPIIVTSPTIRSGTTLLQRLLCSSPKALIYGEECGKDLELFLQIYASKVAFYSHSRQKLSISLERVLAGDVNDWILDLMPDIDGYLEALGRAYISGLAYCRDYAVQVGRPVWGIKFPGWSPPFISLKREVMPRARFLIIYRDVADCLRSAKARGSVTTEQEARQFCNKWTNNLTFMLGMRNDPSVFIVKYADLITAPQKVTEMIAGFAGTGDMRIEILSHKINTWVDGRSNKTNQLGYIEPVALTETETRIADESASPLRMACLI